jgi:hypothetical protein
MLGLMTTPGSVRKPGHSGVFLIAVASTREREQFSVEAFWKPAAPEASRSQGGPGSGFAFFPPRVSELQAASG